MAGNSPRIFISAGEPPGDAHAAPVARALRARYPSATLDAFGGRRLAEAGVDLRFSMEGYTVVGFVEVLGKIPAHLRLLRTLERDFKAGRYDLVLLLDYPGFHLRLAEAARRHRVPVLYYIAPQLWAWRPERARRFAAAVDRLAVVLPFETEFFAAHGLRAEYVGHPLVDRPPLPTREAARNRLGLAPDARTLGIFPGSRPQEIARLWAPFRDAARLLRNQGHCDRVIVAGIEGGEYPGADDFLIHRGAPDVVFAAPDAALAKSGTTTLEAAIADVPMVVAYRVHPLTSWIARRLITVPWISLVNLVAGEAVVPELTQGRVTPEQLAEAAKPLLDRNSEESRAQRAGLKEVRARLGGGGAAERVAAIAGELLG